MVEQRVAERRRRGGRSVTGRGPERVRCRPAPRRSAAGDDRRHAGRCGAPAARRSRSTATKKPPNTSPTPLPTTASTIVATSGHRADDDDHARRGQARFGGRTWAARHRRAPAAGRTARAAAAATGRCGCWHRRRARWRSCAGGRLHVDDATPVLAGALCGVARRRRRSAATGRRRSARRLDASSMRTSCDGSARTGRRRREPSQLCGRSGRDRSSTGRGGVDRPRRPRRARPARRALSSTRRSSEPTAWLYALDRAAASGPARSRWSPSVPSRLYRPRPRVEDLAGRCSARRVLLPGVGDGAQQREQRGGRREHHALWQRVLHAARGPCVQRLCQERLARDEQHDELRRGRHQRPVRLGGQLLDVGAQCRAWAASRSARSSRRVVVGRVVGRRAAPSRRRRLRPPARRTTMSGRRRPSSRATVTCVVKSHVLDHAGELDDRGAAAARPSAADLRRRSAVTSCAVSRRSSDPTSPHCRTCSVSAANACARRARSRDLARDPLQRGPRCGLTRLATAWRRCSSSAAPPRGTRWRSSVSSGSRLRGAVERLVREQPELLRAAPPACGAGRQPRSRPPDRSGGGDGLATSSSACLVSAAGPPGRPQPRRTRRAGRPARPPYGRSVALAGPPEADLARHRGPSAAPTTSRRPGRRRAAGARKRSWGRVCMRRPTELGTLRGSRLDCRP